MPSRSPSRTRGRRNLGRFGLGVLLLTTAACSSDAARDARLSRDLAELMGWSNVEQVLQHSEHDVRLDGVRSLATMADPIVVPFLTEALWDSDMRVRRDAARALGQRGLAAADSVPALTETLHDPRAIVRSAALHALGEIGGRDAAEALIAHLRSVEPTHYEDVLLALGTTGHDVAINEIAAYLSDRDPFVRRAATVALVRIGPSSVGIFRSRLADADPLQRCEAARSLAMTGDEADVRRLRSLAASDPSVLVRTCSLGAAGRLGDDTALDALVAQLHNGTIEGRSLAADALTLMNTPEVVGPLAAALTDFPVGRDYPNPALRALIGLGDLARPELLSRLAAGASTEEQTLIARALASIGTPDDVAALSLALEDARQEEARLALRDAIASIQYRDERSR